ncbi:hypothetical protein [Flavobacterium sp. J27]|uniref:hypothetical protein n=1 Tax=Flavobacterium sp. J27 TaxID=2060419 RepID=UPI001030EC7D|nr:hypothetical protein [Flavobacterium sp. J27]
MEPNKLDTKIREQLGSREIKPTDQAWDRLDAMLSLAEKKEPKKVFSLYKYIGIAASVLLFIALGFWLYQNDATTLVEKNIENAFINQENTANLTQDTLKTDSSHIENQLLINDEIMVRNDVAKMNTKKLKENTWDNKTTAIAENSLISAHVTLDGKDSNVSIVPIVEEITEHKYMTAEKLLASIENRDAEKNAIKDKVSKTTIKVNTNSLLTVVESELDLEFRESKIDKVTKRFQLIKSALANRNYEE